MSELCSSRKYFCTLLISDLTLLCSFLLSHPLYFSYFIFFSPYLLKLASFFSPLFVISFLLSLAFLTGLVSDNFSNESAESKVSYLLIAYTSVVERLRSKNECDQSEEFGCLGDLGMYEMLFGTSEMEINESPVEELEEKPAEAPPQASECSDSGDLCIGGKREAFMDNKVVEISQVQGPELEDTSALMEEKRMENFLKILDQFERMSSNVEDKKKVGPLRGTKADKVVEKQKAAGSLVKNGSEATGGKMSVASEVSVGNCNGEKEETSAVVNAHSQKISSAADHTHEGGGENTSKVDKADGYNGEKPLKIPSSRALDRYNLGTYGSMRKEKEWKRTLACKLFEERHNVGGGEGMDSLWEAYELDSNKPTKQKNEKKKGRMKREVEEEEEEGEVEGQLCCLQALKLSTGKMNLGMGRPNLVKITRAIKGIGWLHHVSKHSKKVHDDGERY